MAKNKSYIHRNSPTGLEAFKRCARQWFFNRGNDITTGNLALGIFMHAKISQLRVNPRFKSAKGWAGACIANWRRFPAKTGKIRGKLVSWANDGERWNVIPERIEQICLEHFDRLMGEAQPIIFPANNKYGKKVEYKMKPFKFKGIEFTGEIDEIRPGMIIRDYKTGFRSHLERRLAYKFQPTFYSFFYCYEAYTNPRFRKLAGIPDEEAMQWNGNPIFIDPRMITEYYMLEKEKERNPDWTYKKTEEGAFVYKDKDPIMTTTRNDANFHELVQLIESVNRERFIMDELNEYPATRDVHCSWCQFQERCDKMTTELSSRPKQKRFFPVEYQTLMKYGGDFVPFQSQETENEKTSERYVQAELQILKKPKCLKTSSN